MRISYKPIAILLTVLLSMNHLVLAYCQCSLSVSFVADSCCLAEAAVEKDTCCEEENASHCNECAITLEYELEDFDQSRKVFITALQSEQAPQESTLHFEREFQLGHVYHAPFRAPPDRMRLCVFRL